MPHLGIVRTRWSGTTGGPGLTQTAFRDVTNADISNTQAQAAVNAVRAFWNSIAAYLPNEVTLTVDPVVDIYDFQQGDLVATTTAGTPPATVAGTDTSSYPMGAGIKINLQTTVIYGGRRVRGAIFMVPAGGNAYSTSGLVAASPKTAIGTAGSTMRGAFATAGIEIVVWSRPTSTTAGDGRVAVVTALEANEKTAILRGRRD